VIALRVVEGPDPSGEVGEADLAAGDAPAVDVDDEVTDVCPFV
jgi:hypothetical protein